MASKIEPLMTIADLEAMPDDGNRYEPIEGELFVSCAPGLTHQIVLDNIIYLIRRYQEEYPIGMVVSTIGLVLSDHNGVIPDIVFFRFEDYDRLVSNERLYAAPELVVEIRSSGSENIRRYRGCRASTLWQIPCEGILDSRPRTADIGSLSTA